MHTIIFFISFLVVFFFINIYISKRLIDKLDVSQRVKLYFRLFLMLNFLGIIVYMFSRYYMELNNWLYFLVSLPMGVLFLLFCTAIIYDISRVSLDKMPLSASRRDFVKKSLDLSSFVLATGLSARAMYEARFVKHEKIDIKITNLQQKYKIVQISDIHIGGLIDASFIEKIIKRVNAMNPDLVVITGDLVDIALDKAEDALEAFRVLESKYGTYFIVGNHEYFHNIGKIIDKVKSLGIRVLENENLYIGQEGKGFNLAGVYDMFGYRIQAYEPDIYKALKGRDTHSPTILLAHQPKFVEEVGSGVDLMLSGHTHGGQLYPFGLLVRLQQPYLKGLHQHNDALQVYVNKGTGFWGPPMRLGASSEITEINLVPIA